MVLALRLLRIAAAIGACNLLFAGLFEFFNLAPRHFVPPDTLADVKAILRGMPFSSVFAWGVVFRGIGYLYWGTVPLLLSFSVLELLRVRHLGAYCLVWIGAGLVATSMVSKGLVGPVAASAAGLIAGSVYWLLAGRSAGIWVASLKDARWYSGRPVIGGIGICDLAAYAVLAIFAFQLVGYLHYAGKLAWVSCVSEPSLGTPPFKVRSLGAGNRLTAFQKVALLDFPDPASCLQDGTVDLSPETLKRLDWDKIDNDAEAEVCIFRLLGSYEDMSHATDWLESQGFRVSDSSSSARPYEGSDETLRVSGSWSIRERGPKYPTRGIIRRLFRSMPYGMGVNATWSGDGKTLQHVTIDYSTL